MMKEIIKKTLKLSDGEELFLCSIPQEWFGSGKKKEKTRKAFLIDNLIKQTQARKISWISHRKNLFICVAENLVFALWKSDRTYDLTIADDKKLLVELFDNYNDYDNRSRRRPVIDLYDIITAGKRREVPLAHVCGSQGFGWGISDSCPACEAEHAKPIRKK